jgi:AMP-polyphosphate phosphotransferase
MFEAAELGRKISKEDYKTQLPSLRAELLQVQFALSQTKHPVIIIVSGMDAAGRGEVINALNEWLDTRGLQNVAFEQPTDEERERPPYWRYWMSLPGRGRIGVYFGAWYVQPIINYAYGVIDKADMDEELTTIRRFENLLVQDGAVIMKFWLHVSKEIQQKRLKKSEKDPHAMRRVSQQEWKNAELYDKFREAAEHAIRQTDAGEAPWLLVEASDPYYRDLTVGRTVLETLHKRLELDTLMAQSQIQADFLPNMPEPVPALSHSPKAHLTVLDHVDLKQALTTKQYRTQLAEYQSKINKLAWAAHEAKRSTIIVFEGWDAAGKGGAIRRITQAMDARLYRVISVAAPTDEERAHHYLWRFWRHIPRAGRFTFYDRSWYGRVLVERVEKFAQEEEWSRAYLEINSFEEMLVAHQISIIKFWVHISPEEQLRRFEERQAIAYKQHKITEEDWRNREKTADYTQAVNEMVARTSTSYAPWTLVAGEDKHFGRLQVLKTVCDNLEKIL